MSHSHLIARWKSAKLISPFDIILAIAKKNKKSQRKGRIARTLYRNTHMEKSTKLKCSECDIFSEWVHRTASRPIKPFIHCPILFVKWCQWTLVANKRCIESAQVCPANGISISFYCATAMLSAVYVVVVCLWVCLSVCVSVTLRYCIKTAKRRITQTTLHNSPMTLVFRCQRSWEF